MPYSGSTVDEQVVKMSFDNSNFDGNINDSIKALNNLDNKLLSVNKSGFASVTNSINNLANTFTIKGQIMFGVLTRLGNEIVSLGNKAFNKLTKGIRDGLGEYNQIIESTQTIYQNVKQDGKSIDDVNNALDELNDYADKTIYNFGQMTRMIGMFTSAGVSLDKSVSSIKGLANAAALVGATMERAQIGWQAVSRAMSSGKFTNVTWRSLELSGIAGKQFNKVITEVARTTKVKGKQTGKDIDGMIKKWGSLRESLREGWLNKDIFTEAMDIMSGALDRDALKQRKYTDKQIDELLKIAEAAEEAATRVKTFKQLMETTAEAIGSGWAQSFRILIGDLEEAKKLYTRISNVISDFIDNNANIRNELFKQIVNGKDKGIDGKWKSGRDNFRQIIENMLAIVKTFLKSVKTGFYNIFPIERISAAARKLLGVVENFTRAFTLNMGEIKKDGQIAWDTSNIDSVTNHVQNLIRFFRGLASAVDIAWMAISQPIKAVIKHIPFFENFYDNVNTGLLGLIKKLGQFGDKITAFRDAAKDWEIFGYLVDYFIDNIDELGKKYPILGAVLWVFNGISTSLKNLKKGFKELNIKPLSAAFGLFKMVVASIWKVLNGIFGLIRNAKNSVDWSWLEGPKKILINALKTLSDYGRGLISFEETTKKIGGVLGNFFSKISSLFNKFRIADKNKKVTQEINKQYSKLNDTVDKTGNKLQSVWNKIKGLFSPISDFFKSISANGNLTFDGFSKKIALIGGSTAVAALSITHLTKALKKINILNNISDLLNAGVDVLKAYQKQAQSKTILNIAIAVGILAAAMITLSFVPYEKLENGLTIFTTFMMVVAMTVSVAVGAITKFTNSIAKMRENLDPINNLISSIRKVAKRLANGFIIRMIGKSFIDLAIAIAIVTASLIALKLVFKNPNDLEKPLKTIRDIVITLTVAIGALVVVMEIFSRLGAKISGSVGVFSSFFKLAGAAKVIMAISAAVLVLVAAMAIVSKIDATRLDKSWKVLMSVIWALGIITIAVTAIASRAKDMGKLKKVTISITGAVLGVAAIVAAMALLISETKKDNTNAWIKSLVMFSAVIGQFTAMTSVLLLVAKKVGDQTNVWTKLEKMMTVMTTCLVAISGVLFLLGYSRPIPASVVTTIGIMTAAMLGIISLLSLIAIVLSKAKSTFTTDFVKVIEGISVSIAAIIASLGVVAAGIGMLIFSLSSLDISQSDANKASSNIVEKLAYVAGVIAKALPELKKLFYSIGTSVGTVFTSFTTGFIDQVISVGETYSNVAEKFVNLIIDLVGKIVTILKSRKEDVAKIIGDIVDFLGAELTAALNAFFKKDGKGMFDQETVTKWAGGIFLTAEGFHLVAEGAKDFNAIVQTGKTIGKVSEAFKGLGEIIKAIGPSLGTIFAIAVAIAGITLAIIAVREAYKRWTGEAKDTYGRIATFGEKAAQAIMEGFAYVGRVIIQTFMTIARGIAFIISGVISKIAESISTAIGWFGNLIGFFNKDAGKAIQDWNNKTFGKFAKDTWDTTEDLIKQIEEGWNNVGNFSVDEHNWDYFRKVKQGAVDSLDGMGDELTNKIEDANKQVIEATENEKEANYNSAFDNFKNYRQGAVDALAGFGDELVKLVTDVDELVIITERKNFDEHSPSKKSYNTYWNYILGAKNALSEGGQELVKIMESNNTKLIKKTLTGVKDLGAAYKKLGVKQDKREGLNKYDNVNYVEKNADGSTVYKTVNLNKQLTESILAEAEALRGLSKEEAFSYINQKNMNEGLGASAQEISDLTNFLYDQHEDRTTLWWDSVTNLQKATTLGWGAVLSAEEQASMEAVSKQEETNGLLAESAENLKKKLVGKKKEQAAEIIKQDLIQRGMTEEQAEEESKKMVALIFAKQKNKNKIELNGLNNAIDIMKAEKDAYEQSVKEQTEILEAELAKREKAAAVASKAMTEVQTKGFGKTDKDGNFSGMTVTELQQKLKEKVEADNRVKIARAKLDQIVADATKRLQKNGLLNVNQFEKDYEDAYKKANTTQKKSGNIGDTLKSFWKQVTGSIPKAPDLTTWNFPTTNNNNNTNNDKDKAVKAAKDTKKALEANRADLTPTFDLDKLSDEAKKANGIVTSSLMAAQNASIGDYINKDSELNPFMKDRWQNVYNFTQNNYSPKALSRTDIYRQTQRQLNLSRGF